MKKRFKNILAGSPRKNGLFVCICTVCITLISGMLIGCSAGRSDPLGEPVQTGLEATDPGIGGAFGTQAEDYNTQTQDHNAQAENDSVQAEGDNAQAEGDNAQAKDTGVQAGAAGNGGADMKSVLLGESDFICTALANKSLNISEIGQAITADESAAVSVIKFAVIDLDDDGEDETVLWLQNGTYDCGFEILHAQNGEIYGYTLWYRAFMELKADGTFEFSGGAADSGIRKMSFSETGYSVTDQAYSQSSYDANNELTVQYFINEEPCSEDEFWDARNAQEQKVDAEWYDWSENNINAVF